MKSEFEHLTFFEKAIFGIAWVMSIMAVPVALLKLYAWIAWIVGR